jgi:hypothetical protein
MKDSKGRTIKIGMSVDVPYPIEGDTQCQEFTGHVEGFHDQYVTVMDGDGDCFDIEPERLTISEDEVVEVSPEELARVIATWIVEASADTLLRIYNENFDAPITFDSDNYVFVVPIDEADRCGMEYDGNADCE